MPITRIDNLNDDRISIYRDLKGNNVARDLGLFLAEGQTVSQRLLDSRFDVHSVLVSDRKWESFGQQLPQSLNVFRTTNEVACDIVGYRFHAGVITAGYRRPSLTFAELHQSPHERSLIVACPWLNDPENVGAIIRIASAFGASAVMFGKRCTDPFSRRVLRVSMGNGLFLPLLEPPDFAAALSELRHEWDYALSAMLLSQSARSLADSVNPARHVVLFGHETNGLDETMIGLCDQQITIPMQNGTDSLNVAVSAGITLYELQQRRALD